MDIRGLGGLDVFVSTINPDGSFGEVQNLGADINSPKDDFAYLIETKSEEVFLLLIKREEWVKMMISINFRTKKN